MIQLKLGLLKVLMAMTRRFPEKAMTRLTWISQRIVSDAHPGPHCEASLTPLFSVPLGGRWCSKARGPVETQIQLHHASVPISNRRRARSQHCRKLYSLLFF